MLWILQEDKHGGELMGSHALRVIEINTLNGCGLYDIDVDALVAALEADP